jgi:DNA repair protein RadA/Sms
MALAVAGAAQTRRLPSGTIAIGEIGLSGEIRQVAQAEARLKEAAKLGFAQAVAPAPRGDSRERLALAATPMAHVADLVAAIAASRPRQRTALPTR